VAATLVRTSIFLADYRAIALRIGQENPDAANRFCDAIEEALELLAEHPQIGRSARFAAAPEVRRWVLQAFPNYVIYYESRPAEILLIRLLHGAQDTGTKFQ
jgi:plasmid stabilization system protein ParE